MLERNNIKLLPQKELEKLSHNKIFRKFLINILF